MILLLSVQDQLDAFLQKRSHFALVVDEYGELQGLITLEDIIETIIGQEIFEHDDMAVDMREFAMRKHKARIKEENTHSDNQTDD